MNSVENIEILFFERNTGLYLKPVRAPRFKLSGIAAMCRPHRFRGIGPGNKPRRAVAGGEKKAQKGKTARFGHAQAEPGQSLHRAMPAGS